MWLWTDTLAQILVAADQVPAARVAEWIERPVAVRLADDGDAIALARALLKRQAGEPEDATRPA